jgi:hypothetical protein
LKTRSLHKRHTKAHNHRNKLASRINPTFKTKIYIYGDTGFNLDENCHVTFNIIDLQEPTGDKKNGFYVKVEPNSKFTAEGVFTKISDNVFVIPYQYLSSVKHFYDSDKYRYFYFSTTNPKYYNVAIQFGQRADYDDTVSIVNDNDFNTIVSLFSKNADNRKSQIAKLKENFLTSANTFYMSKQKSEASLKGLAEIQKKIEDIKKNMATTRVERSYIQGSEDLVLNIIEKLERELMILRNTEKTNTANLLQKDNLIKQQTESIASLQSGTKTAEDYQKETDSAKEKYLKSGKDYMAEVDDNTDKSITEASNELLTNNNFDKFRDLVSKIV